MKRMKYIAGIFLIILFCGCEDWFNVQPENELSSDDLYATSSGYKMQLNGVYMTLSSSSLYAKELSWGFIDVLGQYYDRSKLTSEYLDVNDRNYGVSTVKSGISAIWSRMYHAVADVNNLIEHITKVDDSFFENGKEDKDLIYGEALALRAFIHFDLLRMFAPAPVAKENGTWIPYVTSSESVTNIPLTVNEVIEKVIADFKQAEELIAPIDSANMENDNWRFWGSSGEYTLFYQRRRVRMNSHGILGLLARVYMYAGMKKEACDYAKSVLGDEPDEDGGIPWNTRYRFTDEWDLMGEMYNREIKLHSDVIMGFANEKCADYYETYMSYTSPLALRSLDALFQGKDETNDFRYRYLVTDVEGGAEVSIKNYRVALDKGADPTSQFLIPLIRHTELSYIICEYLCENEATFDKAVTLLDALKTARGEYRGVTATNSSDFMKQLLNDARREFIGEGQIFYMYKRLGLPLNDGSGTIDFGDKIKLPIPDNEDATNNMY